MVQGVWSENLEQQIDATTQFRKLLSIGELADSSSDQWFAAVALRGSKLTDALIIVLQRETHRSKRLSAKVSSRALSSSCSVRMLLSYR